MSRVRVPDGVPSVARWSSGYDIALSRRKQEFDSPTGHHFDLRYCQQVISSNTVTFSSQSVGAYYDEGPPVPIPNTVVKLIRAEDTWRATAWKNRSVPT